MMVLIILVVAMLPRLAAKPVTPLVWRIPMQALFIVLTLWAGTR